MIEPHFGKSIVFSSGLVNEAIAHKVFTSFRKTDLYVASRIQLFQSPGLIFAA